MLFELKLNKNNSIKKFLTDVYNLVFDFTIIVNYVIYKIGGLVMNKNFVVNKISKLYVTDNCLNLILYKKSGLTLIGPKGMILLGRKILFFRFHFQTIFSQLHQGSLHPQP